MEGACDSKLKVERKLEGIIWDHDKPHMALRSTGAFALDMIIEEPPDKSDEDGSLPDPEECDASTWFPAVLEACNLAKRHTWDASILKQFAGSPIPAGVTVHLSDQAQTQFKTENPFAPFFERVCPNVVLDEEDDEEDDDLTLSVLLYSCTDAFPTRDDQREIQERLTDDMGTKSVCVQASFPYIDPLTGKMRIVCVVAEAPIPVSDGVFVEQVWDRIAGFVFFQDDSVERTLPVVRAPAANTGEDDAAPQGVVYVTYVEACNCDFESLNDSEKDSILEDRALVVNRLMSQVAKPIAKPALYPLTVRTPPSDSKSIRGMPPSRTLTCYQTIQRADPRWPMVPPNSVCLECGKGPKHEDETQRVENLMTFTRCRTRMFCSKECLAKSWKNPVWPHKHECNKVHQHHQSNVGTSLREQSRVVADSLAKVRNRWKNCLISSAKRAISMPKRRRWKRSMINVKLPTSRKERPRERKRIRLGSRWVLTHTDPTNIYITRERCILAQLQTKVD
jgi:hypothetical protein